MRTSVCVCLCLLLAAGAASAQAPAAIVPNAEAAHDALRKLRDIMERALNAQDVNTIVENVHPNVVFTTMNGDVARGRDGVKQYYEKMMKGPDKVVSSVKVHFEPDDLSVLFGGNLAVGFGSTDDHYELTDGSRFNVKARWTATLVPEGDRWVIAAFHYSTNMFDNPVLDMLKRTVIWAALGAFVVAGALGVLLGRSLGKRAKA